VDGSGQPFDPRLIVPVVGGYRFTVAVAPFAALASLAESEKPPEGLMLAEKALILVSDLVVDGKRPAVFWHELTHAGFCDMLSLRAAMFRCESDAADHAEEDVSSLVGSLLTNAIPSDALVRVLAGPVAATRRRKRLPTLAEVLCGKPRCRP
jgi:hypothetical protein